MPDFQRRTVSAIGAGAERAYQITGRKPVGAYTVCDTHVDLIGKTINISIAYLIRV